MVAIGADEKKKLYILGGLAGVLILVVLFVIKPFGRGSSPASDTTTAPPPTTVASSPAAVVNPVSADGSAGMGGAAPGGAPMGSVTTGAGGGVPTLGIVNPRSDPFAPKVIPPVPPPPPPPTPQPPVSLPSPEGSFIPPAVLLPSGGAAPDINQPLGLPPTRIPQYQPRETPRFLQSANIVGSSSGNAQSAPDKRLAGVAIGDSVRALLEINDGQQTITRVVQPGDEVEGVRVLRIERVTEGGNTVTRMVVSQNGQEQLVDLRASTNPIATAPGGPGGPPGFGPPGFGPPPGFGGPPGVRP
ncbi:MAG TPA: hypothetical protein VF600_04075 [Abditibacteriaceae bacterium]|jgi:hypothetical protein